MSNRTAAVSTLALAAVALTGACSEVPPTEPFSLGEAEVSLFAAPSDEVRRTFTGTLDHEFVRIAREIPGFGGFYYDESGTLNVVMAPVVSPMSSAEVRSRLTPRLAAMGQPAEAAQGAVMRPGRYDFAQLFEMRRRVDQVVWSLGGVVFTDADEKANRVAIGVEDAAAAASVEQAMAMAGIPREAVILHETTPLHFPNGASEAAPTSGHSLQDLVRPVAGGLRLESSGYISECTIGFNVRSPEAPSVHGFLMHTFCTTHLLGTGPMGTSFWQPSPSLPGSFIGTEVHDAATFTGDPCPPAPAGVSCRWSFAAGGRYAPGVPNAFGRIYRTTGVNTGSLVIDPLRPMFEILGEPPSLVVGHALHTVGAGGGWAQRTLDRTCLTLGLPLPDPAPAVLVLCQSQARGEDLHPVDHGGPVFAREGEGGVGLIGLVGTSSSDLTPGITFSPMAQIRLENPPPAGRTWRTF
jgi:hypothetical protein